MVVTAWLHEGGDDDEVMEMMTMARGARGPMDRVDQRMGVIFGVGRKSPPEKFSGGDYGSSGGRRRQELARNNGGEGESYEDVNELKTELKRIRTQIIKLQKKQLWQKDKIAFAHYRFSNLEQIIEDIQARHQTDQEDL
ncbi:hypothetical protein Tco_1074396 [Tanacetum coccineum]